MIAFPPCRRALTTRPDAVIYLSSARLSRAATLFFHDAAGKMEWPGAPGHPLGLRLSSG